MDLRRMAILMLLCAAACGVVAYESYRFNVVAVEQMLANVRTQEMFTDLKAGVPTRSQITGFCAIVFGVAGIKLLWTSHNSTAKR